MTSRKIKTILCSIVAGLGVSLYLSMTAYDSCSGWLCREVHNSLYGRLFGIPVAWVGVAEFWDAQSIADYWEELEPAQVDTDTELQKRIVERNKTKRVTLRLRLSQIEAVKEIAKKKDIPYQTLIRSWVAEAIRREEGIDT